MDRKTMTVEMSIDLGGCDLDKVGRCLERLSELFAEAAIEVASISDELARTSPDLVRP